MSHHKYTLKLSKQAEIDFADILLYTLEAWGEQQMSIYQDDVIYSALKTLRLNPNLGHIRPDILDHYRAFEAGQHVIIYKIDLNTVFVSRILHSSMDFLGRILPEDNKQK